MMPSVTTPGFPRIELPSAPRHALAGGAVAVVAVVARLYGLDAESVWLDEAHTFTWARKTVPDIVAVATTGEHNPTYFVFMHYWLALGDDEWMLRAPSAVFGALAAVVTYGLGAIAGGLPAGVAAGLLSSLSVLQVRYGQEARMYALVSFGTVVAGTGIAWLAKHPGAASTPFWRSLARAVRGSRDGAPAHEGHAGRAWLALVLGTTFALYMHNTVVLFVAASGVAWFCVWWLGGVARSALAKNWLLANAMIATLFLPWLVPLATQTDRVAEGFWPKFPSARAILRTLGDLYLCGAGDRWLGALVLGLAVLGAWRLRHTRALGWVLVVLAVGAPVLVLLVSLRMPIFLVRIMLWSAPFFFALCGAGVSALGRPALVWLVVGALGIGSAMELRPYYARTEKPPWRALARALAENIGPGDVVLAAESRTWEQISYYHDRRTASVGSQGILKAREGTTARLPEAVRRARVVWFVSSSVPRTQERRIHKRDILAKLERRFGAVERRTFSNRLDLHRFSEPQPSGKR